MIEFTITNKAREPIDVLRYQTPFVAADGVLPSPLFQVHDDSGAAVAYTGKNLKFVGAQDSSFIHLASGESVTIEVDLARDYALKNGHYKVTYVPSPVVRYPLKTRSLDLEHLPRSSLESNELSIWVNGSLLSAAESR